MVAEPTNRFAKFTSRARMLLSTSQEEAQRLNHHHIGTEHLLLAVTQDPECMAAKALSKLGVDLGKIRSAVEYTIGREDWLAPGELGLTKQAQEVIKLASDEARTNYCLHIGTEHLLIGLLREAEGVAAGALGSLHVTLEGAKRVTYSIPPWTRRDLESLPAPSTAV
ncbi:MAG: hypothetical protein HYW97_00270 [Candidatus Wildermuthbacteria bacterium]|nr:hypothetical protein [Candidatus Wildermuthbacteria bacterium]